MSDAERLRASSDEQQTGWALLASGETVPLARPVERLGARILDFVIVAIPSATWAFIRGFDLVAVDESAALTTLGELLLAGLGTLLVVVLVDLVYEVVPTAVWGQTLGKRILRLKVVNAATGGTPGLRKSLGRWALLILPIAVPYVQYPGAVFFLLCVLTMGHEPLYRGWHDKAAGTLVIKT